mgnify:CR=1 FL=1
MPAKPGTFSHPVDTWSETPEQAELHARHHAWHWHGQVNDCDEWPGIMEEDEDEDEENDGNEFKCRCSDPGCPCPGFKRGGPP